MTLQRLALGTVQFGLAYGVANEHGQVDRDEVATILGQARAAGIDTLDTAIAYGSSEQRLGEAGVVGWRVITKLPPLPVDVADVRTWVLEQVKGSLARLGRSSVDGLLLHRPADLQGQYGTVLWAAMQEIHSDGLVVRLGVSVRGPDELDELGGRFRFDLVQAPFNVLDRRMATSGWARRLRAEGVELHTRSAFLQGLLLMPAVRRPARFAAWAPLWARWDSWLAAARCTPLQACLAFVLSHEEIDRVVVGVDVATQLTEIVAATRATGCPVPDDITTTDLELISPARWRAE